MVDAEAEVLTFRVPALGRAMAAPASQPGHSHCESSGRGWSLSGLMRMRSKYFEFNFMAGLRAT